MTDGGTNAYDPALVVDAKANKVWIAYSAVNNEDSSFYYLRAIQQNNEIAWASPIWVDMPDY